MAASGVDYLFQRPAEDLRECPRCSYLKIGCCSEKGRGRSQGPDLRITEWGLPFEKSRGNRVKMGEQTGCPQVLLWGEMSPPLKISIEMSAQHTFQQHKKDLTSSPPPASNKPLASASEPCNATTQTRPAKKNWPQLCLQAKVKGSLVRAQEHS